MHADHILGSSMPFVLILSGPVLKRAFQEILSGCTADQELAGPLQGDRICYMYSQTVICGWMWLYSVHLQEGALMMENMARVKAEAAVEALAKRAAAAEMMKEVIACNNAALVAKRAAREMDVAEDARLAQYRQQRDKQEQACATLAFPTGLLRHKLHSNSITS